MSSSMRVIPADIGCTIHRIRWMEINFHLQNLKVIVILFNQPFGLPHLSHPSPQFLHLWCIRPIKESFSNKSCTFLVAERWMKLPIKGGSMGFINYPFPIESSVHHHRYIGSVGEGWGSSPLINPILSLSEIYILTIWDHKI